MSMMTFVDENARSAKSRDKQAAKDVRAAKVNKKEGPAEGIFAACPGMTVEKSAALIAAGFDTIDKLAAAAHKDVAAIGGPQFSGKVRAWAAEQIKAAE